MDIGAQRRFKSCCPDSFLNGSKVLRLPDTLGRKPHQLTSRLYDSDALTDTRSRVKGVCVGHALNAHGESAPHGQAAYLYNI